MSFTINFSQQNEILRCEIMGKREKGTVVEGAKQIWTKIANICRESGLNRLLIISHATGDYSTIDAYSINSMLDQYGVNRTWIIAYVIADNNVYETLKFTETVAINRGFRGRLFQDEEEAYNWLVSQNSPT